MKRGCSTPIPGQRIIWDTNRTARFKGVKNPIPGRKFEEFEVPVPGASPAGPMHRKKRFNAI